jgi:hypothetical protein
MSWLFVVLSLLFLKHWIIDFVMQTNDMVEGKAIYGNRMGVLHSLQHALATLLILLFFVDPLIAVALAWFDLITHYHIDYIKMNYGSRDINTKAFWNHLGLDQMAHNFVYLIIVWIYWYERTN